MDSVDYTALMPGVELIPEELPPATLYDTVFGIYLNGTRIGDVGRSKFEKTEWKADMNLDAKDSRCVRFHFVTGKGETPVEAIKQALLGSDKDFKIALAATRTLSFAVLGTMKKDFLPWSMERKRNQLQFAYIFK